MCQISVRVDDKVKKEAEKVCKDIGISLSSAINIYLKRLGREKRIPFELTAEIPNELTQKVIEEAEKGINMVGPFDNVADLMKSLDDGIYEIEN